MSYNPLARALGALLAIAALMSCDRGPAPAPAPPREVATTPPAEAAPAPERTLPPAGERPPLRHPGGPRIVAVGDVHGDLDALRQALRAASLINDQDRWIGAESILVQTGDILDRGDDEQEALDLLDAWRVQARAAGGDVVELLGNHEVMNVAGDLRYVTPGGFADFTDAPGVRADAADLVKYPAAMRARMAAFRPGGVYATRLAAHNVIGVVGDTAFVHGGLLPPHVDYGLAKLNDETAAWMTRRGPLPELLNGKDSPLWTRALSTTDAPPDCAMVEATLEAAKVKRIVVGHTVQPQGITSACEGKVWRIDVGLARRLARLAQARLGGLT